jgi:hypothetical protein
MLELILVISVSFASGYGVRDRMSRRRRKEARKRYYERHPGILKPARAPKSETATGATGKEPTVRGLHERLSRLEDRIFGARLETETFCDEARSEFVATRMLLERKFEEPEHNGNNAGVLAHQTTAQRLRRSDCSQPALDDRER